MAKMTKEEAEDRLKLDDMLNQYIQKGGVWEEQMICPGLCDCCGQGLLLSAWMQD